MPEKKPAKTTRTTRTASARAAAKPARAAVARARRAPVAKAAKPARRAEGAKTTRRRQLVGVVIADRTPKTVNVEVTRLRAHPLYRKVIRVRAHYPTHDPNEEARLGDLVRIEEGRPYSATKRFRVVEVLSRAGEAREAAPEVGTVEAALEELEGVTALLPAKKEAVGAAKLEEREE